MVLLGGRRVRGVGVGAVTNAVVIVGRVTNAVVVVGVVVPAVVLLRAPVASAGCQPATPVSALMHQANR